MFSIIFINFNKALSKKVKIGFRNKEGITIINYPLFKQHQNMIREIPSDNRLESGISLLFDGFNFSKKRYEKLNTDIFRTRIMFEKAICMKGEHAANFFYDNEFFIRKDAVPKRIQKTLLGEGGVHSLDGEEHQHRKMMLMSFMTHENINKLIKNMEEQWEDAIFRWEKSKQIRLFDESLKLIFMGMCQWAGVPLNTENVEDRTIDFISMIESFGGIGPRHWRGRKGRNQSEKWMMSLVEKVRNKELNVEKDSALYLISLHRDLKGKLLDKRIAAVEVINVIRPALAISYYLSFIGVALHKKPEYRRKLQFDDGSLNEWFVNEIRRFYPLAPFTAARVKKNFEWNNYEFTKGTLVFLDIYNTNLDPRIWKKPEEFYPERFASWKPNAFNFIPQGGGDFFGGHRCAGEWITIALMKQAITFLTSKLDYLVPEQDLSFSKTRVPTFPKSRFLMGNVTRVLDLSDLKKKHTVQVK